MEVHHHPNVEKKSFKEYLLEGLMIFLAVSMGFIAENIRENISEHEIEKRNMELIVDNLKEDTTALRKVIINKTKALVIIDSMLQFRNKNLKDYKTFLLFYSLFNRSQITSWFRSNQSGLDQMKSSGNLRLVENTKVLDSLYRYEKASKSIELYNGDQDRELIMKSLQLAAQFLVFDDINPQTFNLESQNNAINIFYNYNSTVYGNYKDFYIPQLQKQFERGKRLINLLQEEFKLENK